MYVYTHMYTNAYMYVCICIWKICIRTYIRARIYGVICDDVGNIQQDFGEIKSTLWFAPSDIFYTKVASLSVLIHRLEIVYQDT